MKIKVNKQTNKQMAEKPKGVTSKPKNEQEKDIEEMEVAYQKMQEVLSREGKFHFEEQWNLHFDCYYRAYDKIRTSRVAESLERSSEGLGIHEPIPAKEDEKDVYPHEGGEKTVERS